MKMITIAAIVALTILAVASGGCTSDDTASEPSVRQAPTADRESEDAQDASSRDDAQSQTADDTADSDSADDQDQSGTSAPVFDPPSPQLGYAKEVEEDGWVEWEDTGILVAKDQLIVVAELGADRDDVEDALDAVGVSIVGEIPSLDLYQAELQADKSLSDAIDALVGNSVIEDAFPNPQVSANSQPPQPNDPFFDLQKNWYLDEINVLDAWEIHKGSREVAIAVVDTGVDEIDDLATKIIKRYNTTTKGTDTEPKKGERNAYHGTRVAGVAAAIPDNGKGMAGIGWDSSLIAIKASKNLFSMTAGIDAAIDQGAKIINVSSGITTTGRWLTRMKRMIDKAVQNDVLIVAATSNEPPLSLKGWQFALGAWPAMYSDSEENVMAVAGTDTGQFKWGWGADITVSAPYQVIAYDDFSSNVGAVRSGTSYAAPQVSGLAALIWSMDYEENGAFTLKPSQVREIIEETANNPHNDPDIGAGVIDAHAALVRTAEILGIELPESRAEPPPAVPTLPALSGDAASFATISAGGYHSCGLRGDGTVECWGSNDYGQSTPPDGQFVSVSAGDEHSCGVREDGTVECWGSNESLYSDWSGQSTPPDGQFVSVSAGRYHSCGVREDGTVECWGSNEDGQSTPPGGKFVSVSAGDEHSCGVREDGTVECWGSNYPSGQSTPPGGKFVSVSAGRGHSCGVREDGTVDCWGAADPSGGKFVSVSAGGGHSCGVREDGTVECWGGNYNGQSTPPDGKFVSFSAGDKHSCGVREDGTVDCWGAADPSGGKFVSFSAGDKHSCGLREDGAVECWGWDRYGQSTPLGGKFVSVSAGDKHSCGVREDGTVECWGGNYNGQSTPPDGKFVSVSAGGYHSCGVREDGTVECWGSNESWYSGDWSGQSTPPGGKFVSVSAGGYHSCGVREDGTVECWGSNESNPWYGDWPGQSTPPGGKFVSVSAGNYHSCGVREDGTVECWGSNEDGQSTPPGGKFASVSTGGYHSCGVREDGRVECWGENDWGQSTPPDGKFISVSSGMQRTCGVREDGTVECWGDHAVRIPAR